MVDYLQKFESYQRLMLREVQGHGTTIQILKANLDQAFHLFNNSFDPKEKAELWRIMHLVAIDIATVTENICPEPEKNLYANLESDS